MRQSHRTLSLVGLSSVLGLLLSGCAADAGDDSAPGAPTATVVATTTQVGSVAEQITQCAGGQTQVLMGVGDDPHQFEASSAQIADMITADLVIANGLGLEASMQRSISNAVTDGAQLFELGPHLNPLSIDSDDHHHDHNNHGHEADSHEHEPGDFDAHIWMDVSRMAQGAELIGQRLAEITEDESYTSCGVEVAEQLRTVDAEIADILSPIESARLVTDHAAYGYFADRYGVEISGVVIPGGSTDGEPSSRDLTDLTNLLNNEGADALVTSKANTNRMITALAEETDHAIPVVELYEAAIGEVGSEAQTYQDAMLYNANALVEALN